MATTSNAQPSDSRAAASTPNKIVHQETRTQHISRAQGRLSSLLDIYILSWLVLPYIVRPLDFIDIYFPKIGFFKTTSGFTAVSIPNLAGKVILVTGGNSGLGKETVLQLAKHSPYKIFLAARTESKAIEAINSINNQITEKVDIEWLPLDLTSLPSVKTAAEKVASKTARLDILILNAGIMAVPHGKTEAGFEIQLGTNHVGHFLLTKLLMPTLQKTATAGSDVRVVTVSSEAHNLAPGFETIVNTEKLCNTSPWMRYGASKAGNIMFASGLAKKYPNLTSTSIHPGVIMTDLYGPTRRSNSLISVGTRLVAPFIAQDVPHGAVNQLWAATTKKEDIKNGGYYTPVGKLQSTLKLSTDENTIQSFWDWTESELAKVGY